MAFWVKVSYGSGQAWQGAKAVLPPGMRGTWRLHWALPDRVSCLVDLNFMWNWEKLKNIFRQTIFDCLQNGVHYFQDIRHI